MPERKKRLAADGALVAVHYGRNEAAASKTAAAINQAGGRAFTVGAELGVAEDIDTLFAGLQAGLAGRPLDILVNAGGALGTGSIEETTPEEFDRVIALNMRAPFFIIQRALPLLRDGGRIINISSADARIAITRELAYSMAKGAINVLSRTLAHAVGERGITVNTGKRRRRRRGRRRRPAVHRPAHKPRPARGMKSAATSSSQPKTAVFLCRELHPALRSTTGRLGLGVSWVDSGLSETGD